MPVDPNTGNRLPYEGEPGYEEAKKKFPELYAAEEGGDEEEMPGDEGPMDADTEAEAEEAPMAGAPEEIVPERDLKPLMDEADQLMVEEDAAEGEEAPAKSIPQYAEMAPQELADLLSRDFQVLMELERTAAALTKPEMPEEAMMEPEAPMA